MMGQLAPRERLQPALLDRLVDDARDQRQEAPEARVISRAGLREAVLRDLRWLFNTVRPGSSAGLAEYQHVQRSVLNFGLPALSGETASTLDLPAVERHIRQAILDFEPRIMPASLRVEALATETLLDQHNIVSIRIQGQLWAQPVPLDMLLRTDVDLETGAVEIQDLGKAG
jgi:type VI secretion system protein ImpF